jgi:hypothetical protein
MAADKPTLAEMPDPKSTENKVLTTLDATLNVSALTAEQQFGVAIMLAVLACRRVFKAQGVEHMPRGKRVILANTAAAIFGSKLRTYAATEEPVRNAG